MSARVDALVAAANKGEVAAVSSLLQLEPALASASRGEGAGTERCPALARAAAMGHAEVVKLLLSYGADPNAEYRDGYGTALTAACECLAHGSSDVVRVLLDAGADAAQADALFVACSTYARNAPEKHWIVRQLMALGETADQHPAVLAVHGGDVKVLTACIARDPGLITRRFPEVEYLSWPLHLGAPTLMHIAADFGELACIELLLAAGADPNVRAGAGEGSCGYQTPVFHCIASEHASGLAVLKRLIAANVDLGVTAKVSFPPEAKGVCEGAGTVADLKPLGLAMRFEKSPAHRNSAEAARLLRDAGAVE